MTFGYSGRILHLNLNDLSWEIETPDDAFYRKYLGGSALGTYYLLKNTPKGTSAFSPANTIVFSVGLIAGVPISGNSRVTVTAKSPLTDGIGDAQAGGFFPAEMKFSGFDAVVIKGKAKKPVYLFLNDGEVEIRSAEHLWGKNTADVEDLIREELEDKKIEVMQAGIAGENLVRYAAVINNANRAAGRTGMGAVMGSKNFKAIAVRGKQKPKMADKDAVNKLIRYGVDTFPESNLQGLGLYGTAGAVKWQNKSGGLPTRNWESGTFEGFENLDGVRMAELYLTDRDTCYACTIRCKRVVEITEGPFKVDPRYGGPEYETLATFGSYCGGYDLLWCHDRLGDGLL
jgi:aldehyde:ferredoxin oxidoreductase